MQSNLFVTAHDMWPDVNVQARAIEMKLQVVLNEGHCTQLLVFQQDARTLVLSGAN